MAKFSLLITLFAALVTPLILARFKITRVPGAVSEIIMGIIIGKTGFNLVQPDLTLRYLANLGVIMLIFLGGMEINFKLLEPQKNKTKEISPLGIASVGFFSILIMSLILSTVLYATGLFHNFILATILFCTIAMGVLISLLKETGLLDKEYGQTILLTAVLGEFIPLLALTIYSAVKQRNYVSAFGLPVIFLIAIFLLHRFKPVYKFFDQINKSTTQLDIRLAFFLIFALVTFAEQIGAESILGAFLAGAVMKLLQPNEDTQSKLSSMGYGFFIPIFFIVTGVNLNLRTLFSNQQALLLIPIFLIAFIVSKAIVYFVFKPRFGHRLAMAASVLTATTITLVLPILEVGKSLKLISATQAGAITLAAIITCLVCPTLFNKIIDSKKAS
ncbi:cation:proton antiporter [Companilactobacillus sp.]|jgi:CPA2 family monovalent cation:H+ antiporter-2|uniref:cation:proton antiporter n=1 Tax=Companilactobacillus sp. TaxID=2767905 RepID=UPI0025BA5EB9|nr:cation:proton antiporter [Companilactobacillus sp.]MCH4008588.1 cation:proton antiporter [Companilactobacillus sp.]MCH4051233.1 cation:proton antiporter [Companilactobacillus sp.]MCH4076531.1 cation:proton antiporter [Companilactobacillus sp.]MCH4125106.1 cation:proton antiporter [Companilactobacillus sp.]MCH4131646.1 cation:proton antiporter [Companilactobacillus sp.]